MPFAGRKHHGDCRFRGTIANRTCLCRGAACAPAILPIPKQATVKMVCGRSVRFRQPVRDGIDSRLPPRAHFLALRALSATSAFGLLAMTVWGAAVYRQPHQSSVQRRERHAAPLQRMAGLGKLSAFHFQLSIFLAPSSLQFPPIKRRPRCECSGPQTVKNPHQPAFEEESVSETVRVSLSHLITRRSGRSTKNTAKFYFAILKAAWRKFPKDFLTS